MKRPRWMGVLLLAGAGALNAQQSSQGQYQGTSNPPPDGTITTTVQPETSAKPAPGRVVATPQVAPAQQSAREATAPQPAASAQSDSAAEDGIVMLAPDNGSQPSDSTAPPALAKRESANDPDSDIVHPAPLPPGTLGYGTTIRTQLIERLSTSYSAEGDKFRARVISDVLEDGNVLIPTGAEIDGTVADVSTGRLGGHGSMVLHPQTVTLPGGSKFRLYAQVTGTPGAKTRIGEEGEINPGSRLKKDSIEYGGGVGAGAVAGAALGGPTGALVGTLLGAGAITLHLLTDHPQATLEEGTVLVFSLTQPLHMTPATGSETTETQPGSGNGSNR